MNITDTLKFIQLSVYGDPTRQVHLSKGTNLKGKNKYPNGYPFYPNILVTAQMRANSHTNRSRERVYYNIYENVLYMAVFDGEGDRGQTPAGKAIKFMDKYFTRERLRHFGEKWATSYDEWKTKCEKAINELFDKMDKKIYLRNEEYWDGMGTTCTLVIAVRRQNGEYWVLGANVGHSPALLFDISHDMSDTNLRFQPKLLFKSHRPDNINEYERIRNMPQVSYQGPSDYFKTKFEKVKLVYDNFIRSREGNEFVDWSNECPVFTRRTKNGQEYTKKEDAKTNFISVRGNRSTKAILAKDFSNTFRESRTATRLVGDRWWKHGIIHNPSFTFFKIPPSFSTDYPDFTAIAVGSAGFWNVWSYEDFVKRAYKEWNATGDEEKMTEKIFKLNTKQWKQFMTPAKGLKKMFSWLYKTEYPDASLVMAILQ